MTWTGFVLAAGLILGQPPAKNVEENRDATAQRAEQAARVNTTAELAEDVEVMRRILNKSVGLSNEPATVTYTPDGFHRGMNAVPNAYEWPQQHPPYGTSNTLHWSANVGRPADPFDGVYLRGHGVVYTLKVKAGEYYSVQNLRRHAGLAAGCTVCHNVAPVEVSKLEPVARSQAEPTEWDRTRNDLRGVKAAAPSEPAPTVDPQAVCRPGKLTEALLTALMKNGRHIRHLAAGEAVTLVVTLDGLYGPARVAATMDGNQAVAEFMRAYPNAPQPTQPAGNRPPAPAPRPEARPGGFTEDETRQITVGDLHMKQNNPKDAMAAYHRALARSRKPDGSVEFVLTPGSPATAQQAQQFRETARKAVEDVCKKLASAAIAAGHLDEAKKALDAAGKVEVVLAAADKEKPAAAAPVMPVPAKLVITVKKADLDRAEKLSLAEFKKLVTVETVGLPPPDKAKK